MNDDFDPPLCDIETCGSGADQFVRIPGHATTILCNDHATAAARFDKRHCDCCGRTIRVRLEAI